MLTLVITIKDKTCFLYICYVWKEKLKFSIFMTKFGIDLKVVENKRFQLKLWNFPSVDTQHELFWVKYNCLKYKGSNLIDWLGQIQILVKNTNYRCHFGE